MAVAVFAPERRTLHKRASARKSWQPSPDADFFQDCSPTKHATRTGFRRSENYPGHSISTNFRWHARGDTVFAAVSATLLNSSSDGSRTESCARSRRLGLGAEEYIVAATVFRKECIPMVARRENWSWQRAEGTGFLITRYDCQNKTAQKLRRHDAEPRTDLRRHFGDRGVRVVRLERWQLDPTMLCRCGIHRLAISLR